MGCCASRQSDPVSMSAMRSFGWPAEAGEWDRSVAVQSAVRSVKTADATFNMIRYICSIEGSNPPIGGLLPSLIPYFAGSSQGTIGINGAGFASGEAKSTAIAPRSAPVKECVTSG